MKYSSCEYMYIQYTRHLPGSILQNTTIIDETLNQEPLSQNKKVQQKCNSSKYLSAFLQATCHQSRHPG
jgi:hypothetical protein